jgi:predicted RNase H-like nuclease (RuvC/YqgF family)
MLSRLYALDSEEGEKRMTEAKVRSTLAENRKLNRSIDELEERIEQLQKSLEEQGKRYAAKCDEIAALNRREMDAFRELNELAHLCEARVVYLLCKLAGDPAGKVEFDEGDFKAWAATHEWKMTPEVNEDGGSIVLQAFEYEVREIKNETGGPAGENPETSGRETDGAAESETEN